MHNLSTAAQTTSHDCPSADATCHPLVGVGGGEGGGGEGGGEGGGGEGGGEGGGGEGYGGEAAQSAVPVPSAAMSKPQATVLQARSHSPSPSQLGWQPGEQRAGGGEGGGGDGGGEGSGGEGGGGDGGGTGGKGGGVGNATTSTLTNSTQ